MEIALPLVAMSGLYLINNQSKKKSSVNNYESFTNKTKELPNTNIPNKNYPQEYPILSSDVDTTSSLSVNNKFDSPNVYTDKYFNPTNTPSGPIPAGTTIKNISSSGVSNQYYSLTGEKVDSTYFQHNNMVPFFGSNLRTNHSDANSKESILDNMNGTGSQIFSKKEQSPLFSPHNNLQWAHGAPNVSDFYQSRVNPSNRMANVKPFAEERVAPGLGLGYTTEGAGGFNSGMAVREQWLDKSVDELRVANKPKSSEHMLIGHEGPAMSKTPVVSTYDAIGQFEKNRPDRHFEMGTERLFTTTGAVKGHTLHSIPIEREQSRSVTTTSYSGAASSNSKSTYVTGEYMPSTNIELGEVPFAVANANGRNYATDADYGIQSKKAYPNNRSQNQQGDYFGAMGGAIGAVVAPLLDALRPSRRENTIGNLRPYQNAKSSVSQSYIFNPSDRPNTTIRETTENSKFHLNVNANQRGGAYEVTEHQAITNARQTTGDFYYAGVAGAGDRSRQPRPYDAEYNQRNNDVKSSTIQGYMVQGNMNLLNSNMNIKQNTKDEFLKNNRAVNPSMASQIPDINTFGQLQGSNNLYSNIQLDRNTPDILDSLKGNPYALSVTKGV
jgi:hypothetical protein